MQNLIHKPNETCNSTNLVEIITGSEIYNYIPTLTRHKLTTGTVAYRR